MTFLDDLIAAIERFAEMDFPAVDGYADGRRHGLIVAADLVKNAKKAVEQQLNDDLPAAVDKVIEAHKVLLRSSGDGYREPREEWFECSCGATWFPTPVMEPREEISTHVQCMIYRAGAAL